jgi:signal transduction histidine kinase
MVDRDRAYREMSRYVKVRDNFFSMVSHELKTPMTTLKLKNQMQLRKLDPESSIFKSLNENVNLVNKMNRVISDMLDMSLIKSGNLHMVKRNFNISEIVNLSVVNSKSNLPSNRQILFKNQNPNIYAILDAERIVHVLESLIRNAEQHGEGLITVSVTESVYSVKILVKDQGIISDLLRKKIFKKYELADVGHGGLGLGMYIAQKVIRAHQGWFYLEDCLNTSFCIEIPKITTN